MKMATIAHALSNIKGLLVSWVNQQVNVRLIHYANLVWAANTVNAALPVLMIV
jgi:hypothetical protein